MLALIDADIVAYRCAASCKEGDPVEIAIWRADKLMRQILEETQASEHKVFLSGGNNFRHAIYPEYKANRKDTPRPPHLQPTREFLVVEWRAEVCDGIEADDALGIAQTSARVEDEDGCAFQGVVPITYTSVICTIDKDLKQVPGLHYNFVKQEWDTIGITRGLHNFYRQVIIGDRSDNVPGFDGNFRSNVPKFIQVFFDELECLETPEEMYAYCLQLYNGDEETLERNARLLYILREEGQHWQKPIKSDN